MRVRYTAPAQADLDEIYTYISESNPPAAERIKRQVKIDIEILADLPYISKQSDYPGIRIRKVRRYPYLVFYSVSDDEVRILRPPRRATLAVGRRRLNYPV